MSSRVLANAARPVAWRGTVGDLHAALGMLRAVRLISEDEGVRWNERILAAISESRPERPEHPDRPYRAANLADIVRQFEGSSEAAADHGLRRAADPRAQTGGWQRIDAEGGYPLWGASPFLPAVPERARRLEARHGDDWFTIDLR